MHWRGFRPRAILRATRCGAHSSRARCVQRRSSSAGSARFGTWRRIPRSSGRTIRAAGDVRDPTVEQPDLTQWAILANGLFLQPALARSDPERLARNHAGEPEMVEVAHLIAAALPVRDLDALVDEIVPELQRLSVARRRRLGL